MKYQNLAFKSHPRLAKRPVEIPGAYTFRPLGPFKKLQTFLWNFLLNSGSLLQAVYFPPVEDHLADFDFDTKSLVDNILKQKAYILTEFPVIESLYILMGSEDFYMLTGEVNVYRGLPTYFSFSSPGQMSRVVGAEIRSLTIDVEVEVVPWIKGIALLPTQNFELTPDNA